MFLAVTGMLMSMAYTEEQRRKIGNVVESTRLSRGLGKEQASRAAKINSITWKRVEDGLDVRDASLSKILASLGLPSAREVLEFGLRPGTERSPLPRLPRGAPNTPVYSQILKALGANPGAPNTFMQMSSTERAVLSRVRSKIFQIGNDDAGITDEEAEILTRFIEDGELRTLHARIDWLPRAEQLEISALANDLESRLVRRWVADGYSNESPHLPDYAQPNPLPREGAFPDPQDFPVQVPMFTTEESPDAVPVDPRPSASGASDAPEDQELDRSSDDAEVGPSAAEVDAAAGVSELKNDSGVDNAK